MAIRKPTTPKRAQARRKPKRELTIWDELAAIGATIPKSELARIPADAARNLHHYLSGAPKQDPD
jgi:hypothetical protein